MGTHNFRVSDVEVLSATVELDRLQYQNTLSSLVDTTNKLLDTTNKLHAEFKRYIGLYNIPHSPIIQHEMCAPSIQPPSLMLTEPLTHSLKVLPAQNGL